MKSKFKWPSTGSVCAYRTRKHNDATADVQLSQTYRIDVASLSWTPTSTPSMVITNCTLPGNSISVRPNNYEWLSPRPSFCCWTWRVVICVCFFYCFVCVLLCVWVCFVIESCGTPLTCPCIWTEICLTILHSSATICAYQFFLLRFEYKIH